MIDLEQLEKYITLLNTHITSIANSNTSLTQRHDITSPEVPSSASGVTIPLLLKVNDEYDKYSQNELILMHCWCHNWKDTGIGELSTKDIKNAHTQIKLKLKNHERFDNLDNE